MKTSISIPFIIPSAILLCSCSGSGEPQQPNIIFIQCDQLNKMALGCYGGPVPTPNIDRLASEGVLFSNAICSTPVSTPSRGSIVTALYPHGNGIVSNVNDMHNGINEDDITTDKILNANGYNTHHYGKWHLESNGKTREMNLSYFPDPYTFEVQYRDEYRNGFICEREKDNGEWMNFYGFPFPVELSETFKKMQPELKVKWAHRPCADFAMKMGRLRAPGYKWHDEICTEKTLEKIEKYRNSDKPFAITCSFIWPHDPNFVHDPYYSSLSADSMELSAVRELEKVFCKDWSHQMMVQFKDEGTKEFLRIYLAAVRFIDDQVGRIYKKLEDSGKLDNTVIVFTADHGDMMTAHEMIWKSTSSFYKEIVDIPLIISCPSRFKGNRISDAQVNVVDFMPTFLALAGIGCPEDRHGKSLLPILDGTITDEDFRKYNFTERVKATDKDRLITKENKGSFMAQTSEWKYIVYENGKEFLYNRKSDPSEIADLACSPQYINVRKEFHSAIKSWLNDTKWKGADIPDLY